MNINDFNGKWYSAFGWKLDEAAAKEWSAFVEHPKSNDAGLSETLREFSEEYNQAKADGKSNYRDRVPTLDEFKKRYFATLPERKRRWDAEERGSNVNGRCLVCGGTGKVYALAPCIGDIERERAPEDWRTLTADRMYYGAECYPCPICLEGCYHGNHTVRNRVLNTCVPETVPANHKDNPYGRVVSGDWLILNRLYDRFAVKRNGVGIQRVDKPGFLRREDLTPEALREEEARLDAELTARFGEV